MKSKEIKISLNGSEASIVSSAELVAVLEILDSNDDRKVLNQIGNQLNYLIKNGKDLHELCVMLSDENRIKLFGLIKDNICNIIGNASNLANLLALLADDRSEKALLKIINTKGLRSLIKTVDDAAIILEWVYDSADDMILDMAGADFIMDKCSSGYDVSLILQSLNPGSQKKFIKKAGENNIVKLIHNTRDLAYILRSIPTVVSTDFIKRITPSELKRIISNRNELTKYKNILEVKEYKLLTAKL